MKLNNYSDYKKEAKKTLKSVFKLYDALSDNTKVYSRSDDVLEALNSAIFQLGCSVCPSECLSIDDMRDWIMD
jgi:hypothetical protein